MFVDIIGIDIESISYRVMTKSTCAFVKTRNNSRRKWRGRLT